MSETSPQPEIDGPAEIALMEILYAAGVDPKNWVNEGIIFWHGKHNTLENLAFQQKYGAPDDTAA